MSVQLGNTSLSDLVTQLQAIGQDILFILPRPSKGQWRDFCIGIKGQYYWWNYPPNANRLSALPKTEANVSKSEDLEKRLWYNSIRKVGIPECRDGNDATALIEKWLAYTMGREVLKNLCCRKGCMGLLPALFPLATPWSLYSTSASELQTETDILHSAMELKSYLIKWIQTYAIPGFSQEVQKQRDRFQEVKSYYRQFNLQYSMLYHEKA